MQPKELTLCPGEKEEPMKGSDRAPAEMPCIESHSGSSVKEAGGAQERPEAGKRGGKLLQCSS